MAKIILTSRYFRNPKHSNIGKLVKYMGTREGVEKLPNGIDNSPATKRQQNLVRSIVKNYPDSKKYLEYKDYESKQTKANATEFIDTFIERNADRAEELKALVSYIAERPSVEKLGKHGLFSQSDDKINLDSVADEVANHKGIVWTHVISLKREDAERLGYNNADKWKKQVRKNMIEIAKAHNIQTSDLQWYAAFHNTTNHPHIHLLVYSKSGQGYLTNKGIETMRSAFGNDIFRNEQYKLFKQQTEYREELKDSFDELLEEIIDDCNYSFDASPQLFSLILDLRKQLDNCKGKKVYGYLPKKTKDIVNKILKELMKDENLSELYDKWNEINNEKLSLYYDNKNKSIPIEDNKEFRSIKNKIIQAVLNMNCNIPYQQWHYTDNGMILSSVVSLLADMFNMSAQKRFDNLNNQIDKKQLSKEQEKRLAHGLRDLSSDGNYNDDYEEEQGPNLIM
ncbi:MAG: relaxase MobL [Acetobacter sp.]|nr:relaxase MobL [Bacteroides sp.]MCM1340947.1 relaxase MobL [Acetobacter sp.]MCM1432497.1 relaxase MobL [Clostridiales bacterium]